MTVKRTYWPLLAVLFWCCEDRVLEPELPPVPPDELTVLLTVEPDSINPGQSAIVTARAELPDTLVLADFDLRLSGLIPDTVLDPPITSAGTLEIRLLISPPIGPIEGTVYFDLLASTKDERDSAHAFLVIQDDGPPRLAMTVVETVDPPDSMIAVAYHAEDAAGITGVRFQVGGAVQLDTIIWVDYEAAVEGNLQIHLPPATGPGDSVTVQATVWDGFGKETVEQRLVRVADLTAPILAVNIDTLQHSEIDVSDFGLPFLAGDTVRIRLVASDNHSLTWLGYRMLTFGDSVTPGSANDSVRFELVIPPGTNSPAAAIEVFASDSSGNRTEQLVWSVVMDGSIRPISAIHPYGTPLIHWDQQGNYALDPTRDVLYVANSSTKLSVVSLSSLAEQVLDFGSDVRGVDLLPGGDSVAVAVVGRPNLLLIWDIDLGPTAIDTIPLDWPSDCNAWDMQVAENRHVLVTAWGCPTIDVDLDSRSQRFRDVPGALPNLEPSGDHRTIMAWNQDDAVIYWSDPDSFGSVVHLFTSVFRYVAHAGPSFDHAGNTVLIRNRVYDSELTGYRWILPDPGDNPRTHALSADGRFAFIGNWPGYWKVDVATGVVIEKVILPRDTDRIVAHPDGRRLIVFGAHWLGIVDLQ